MSATSRLFRSRWAAIGAAVAVTLGGGGLMAVSAAGEPSSFVPITPTRVLDTRIDAGLSGPFRSAVPRLLDVTGTVPIVLPGDRLSTGSPVPDGATGVVANVTVTNPDTGGFVSLRPGDATGTPSTSTVNFTDGETVANAASVALPANGRVQLFYQGQTSSSSSDIIVDIVGYYVDGAAGPKGDPGDPGPQGATGPQGARGLSAWDEIPSGQAVTGEFVYDTQASGNAGDLDYNAINLPGIAPAALTNDDVNFGSAGFSDTDAACTGTYNAPTAPAGKVCVYSGGGANVDIGASSVDAAALSDQAFWIVIAELDDPGNISAGDDKYLNMTWAYTAP